MNMTREQEMKAKSDKMKKTGPVAEMMKAPDKPKRKKVRVKKKVKKTKPKSSTMTFGKRKWRGLGEL